MPIFMVSRVKDKAGNIVGVGLLDTEQEIFKIASEKQLMAAIIQEKIQVKNVDIINGKLHGTNGSIERYPIIDTKGISGSEIKVTILYKVINKGQVAGFYISNPKGEVTDISYTDLLYIGKQDRITNGKVINGDTISSIIGTYDIIDITYTDGYGLGEDKAATGDTISSEDNKYDTYDIIDVIHGDLIDSIGRNRIAKDKAVNGNTVRQINNKHADNIERDTVGIKNITKEKERDRNSKRVISVALGIGGAVVGVNVAALVPGIGPLLGISIGTASIYGAYMLSKMNK